MSNRILSIIIMEAVVLLCGAAVILIGLGYCSLPAVNAGNLVLIFIALLIGACVAAFAHERLKQIDKESKTKM